MTAALAPSRFSTPRPVDVVMSDIPTPDGCPTDELSLDELGSRIVGLSARIAEAACRWLLLVARFDEREGYGQSGLPSTARWLSHACGIAHRTAVEHVRVARALAAFPMLARGLCAGRLTYSHVRAISRLPRAGEHDLVADLIEVAENGTVDQLESVVRGLRTVDREHEGEAGAVEYVRHSWSSTSHWQMQARLDPERGALVQSAIERFAELAGVSHAEALVRMAELALVTAADDVPRRLRGDERAAIVIHLDAAAIPSSDPGSTAEAEQRSAGDGLAAVDEVGRNRAKPVRETRSAEHVRVQPGRTEAGQTEAGRSRRLPFARIADGPGLPVEVVERLLCEGRIRTLVHDARGNVRDLGRTHRVVSERQFRALVTRQDGSCAFPGCTSRRRLQAHHIRHWIRGGRTDLLNLVVLCEWHHHAHHEGAFHIGGSADNQLRFFRGDGVELEARPGRSRQMHESEVIAGNTRAHAATGVARAHFGGAGERLDRPWAVSVLADRRSRTRPGPRVDP